MAEQDLLVRVKLENDLSRPMDEVRAKVKGTADEIARTGRSSTATAGEMTRLERAASAAGTGVGYLGTHLLVANRNTSLLGSTMGRIGFAVAGAEAVRFGVHAVSSAQQAQTAFTGLLHSGDAAKEMYADLGRIKTPFGLAALTEGTQQLLQMGVTSDQILPSVQGIADAVSAVGGSSGDFSKVAGALGNIHESAKLSADQLRQVGMNSAEVLGKSRGMSGDQVIRGLDNGTLRITGAQAYDALIAGFEAQASGSAAKASTTLTGTLTGLGDTMSAAINKAVGPEQLKDLTVAVGGLAQMIPPLAAAATPFLHVLGDTLGFLGAHPHLTEGLAGLLVFREVAGFALQTSDAVRQISTALSSGNTTGGLRQLLGATSAPGSVEQAIVAAGGGGDDSSVTDTVSGATEKLSESKNGRVAKHAATANQAMQNLVLATGAYSLVGGGADMLRSRFGHGDDGRSWHLQDAGAGAAETAQYAAAAGALGINIAGPLGVPAVPFLAAGGAVFGAGKSVYDYFKDPERYSMRDSSRGLLDAQRSRDSQAAAPNVVAPMQFNITAGASLEDIRAAALAEINGPAFEQRYREAQREDRNRGLGG